MDCTRRPLTDEPVVVREEVLPPPVTEDRLRTPAAYDPTLPYEMVEKRTTTHTRAAFSFAQLDPRHLRCCAGRVRSRDDGDGPASTTDR